MSLSKTNTPPMRKTAERILYVVVVSGILKITSSMTCAAKKEIPIKFIKTNFSIKGIFFFKKYKLAGKYVVMK